MLTSEPGYESLNNSSIDSADKSMPRNINNLPSNTIASQRISLDHDPNYEVLRSRPIPSSSGGVLNTRDDQISDDGYAKVTEKNSKSNRILVTSTTALTIDHGYSNIKEGDNKLIVSNHHDYASIKETSNHNNNNNDGENDSGNNLDIYSSISNEPNVLCLSPAVSMGSGPPNSSLLNSPEYSTVSETRTTTSLGSSRSSDMQNMGYRAISDDFSSKLSVGAGFDGGGGSGSSITSPNPHSSNYESLTESESDPNYEHVKYATGIENPYERLVNEKSPEPKPSKSISSPLLSTFVGSQNTNTGPRTNNEDENSRELNKSSITTTKSSSSLEVSDFFQV